MRVVLALRPGRSREPWPDRWRDATFDQKLASFAVLCAFGSWGVLLLIPVFAIIDYYSSTIVTVLAILLVVAAGKALLRGLAGAVRFGWRWAHSA